MGFRFTLFNSVTLFVLGLTVLTIAGFARKKLSRNWPFLYYLLVLGYWAAFKYSLNTYWVFGGLAAGLLLRFLPEGRPAKVLWWAELAALGYILLRLADLLAGGVLLYYFSTGGPASW